MRNFAEQLGYLTVAQNTDVDYLSLAYAQASNIKAIDANNKYAVVVDSHTLKQVTNQHRKVFDYVIEIPVDLAKDEQWKQSNESQVFRLTPFKETIKLESDLLLTRDVSHLLPALRLKDVCFSYHCKDHQGNTVTTSPYRSVFLANQLPDIYTGMYYFRYTQQAADFFRLTKLLYVNWNSVKENLLHCEEHPSTDVVFALAAKLLGEENFYIPTLDCFNFVHMKSRIQGWRDLQPWVDYVNVEQQSTELRINNLNQYYPVHYHDKRFIIS